MKTTSNKNNVLLPAGILIGAAIGAVAGVLLSGEKGIENRKKLKEVTLKLKTELEKKMKETKILTEESYGKMVDTIVSDYSKVEPVIKENAKKLKDTLKGKLPQKEV